MMVPMSEIHYIIVLSIFLPNPDLTAYVLKFKIRVAGQGGVSCREQVRDSGNGAKGRTPVWPRFHPFLMSLRKGGREQHLATENRIVAGGRKDLTIKQLKLILEHLLHSLL